MTALERCTTYIRNGETCTIRCNLGLWSVTAPFGIGLIDEAISYFENTRKMESITRS